MTSQQAQTIIREVEDLLKEHGIWYVKSLEYKGNLAMIRLSDITLKIDQPRER